MVKRPHRTPKQYYEPFETYVLLSHIKEGDTVIDVGANHGQYTLKFLEAVGPIGEVYAFEPDPTNYEILKRHTASVEHKNLFLEQTAVCDKTGVAYLYLNNVNPGDHRLFYSRDDRQKIMVSTIRLDDYFSTYDSPVSLIKMDIQGAESAALDGMCALIRRQPNLTIASEFWPFGLMAAGINPATYLGKLLELSFNLFEMQEESRNTVPILDPDQFVNKFPVEYQGYTNILATR